MQTTETWQGAADEAYRVVRDGGLALVPVDIGYGFVGQSRESIERMYELKGRPLANPCIVPGDVGTVAEVGLLPSSALAGWLSGLVEWTTLGVVLPLDPTSALVAGFDPWVRSHATSEGTVAIFLAPGRFVSTMVGLAEADGRLLVGSSGNRSGSGNNYRFAEVPAEIRAAVDFAWDGGPARFENDARLATTIVDLTGFGVRRCGVDCEQIMASYAEFAAAHQDLPASLAMPVRR